MEAWALDLGTTNSGLARWDPEAGAPRLVELPSVCRVPDGGDVLAAPRLVPTAVQLLSPPAWEEGLGRLGSVARRLLGGRTALVGRPALEANRATAHPGFVPGFKPALGAEAGRTLARVGRRGVSAREAARAFLRELLSEVRRETGKRVRDLVVSAPVAAFETYRAELKRILESLGVRRVRFLDEPLAAALGYGLGLSSEARALVVDVGGGTMHVELVCLSPRGTEAGRARVLAKRGRPLGGDAVDSWILRDVCSRMGRPLSEEASDEGARFWRRLMLAEACRVKEAVFFAPSATFLLAPPGLLLAGDARLPGASLVTLTRDRLAELLAEEGFYRGLESSVDGVLSDARLPASEVDEVLLVGGSTLLPGVFALLERRFERRKLRGWQPFEAVAHGAAAFAAGQVATSDHVVHDYAFLTYEPRTGAEVRTVVVPAGTRYPTAPDLWKRQLVPTCALGEPERVFKLVVCEVARADDGPRRFAWDASGDLRKVGGGDGEAEVVVPLNAASPTLGTLDPPHDPADRTPRLEVSFGVNADRWLVATVTDLRTRRELMREEPVVRLL